LRSRGVLSLQPLQKGIGLVDFMPPWDDLASDLPAYTRREIYELCTARGSLG